MINSRKIGDIQGSSFGSNANIQGDHVNQFNIQESPEIENALKDLHKDISLISDETKKDNANMHYEMLVKSIEQNNPTRIERCLKVLKSSVTTVASIFTIASEFGITL